MIPIVKNFPEFEKITCRLFSSLWYVPVRYVVFTTGVVISFFSLAFSLRQSAHKHIPSRAIMPKFGVFYGIGFFRSGVFCGNCNLSFNGKFSRFAGNLRLPKEDATRDS